MDVLGKLRALRSRGDGDGLAGVLRSLAGDSVVYLIGSATIGLGNFILVPLYTRHLRPAEFGVFGLIEILLLTSMMAAQLGLGVSYIKWFADADAGEQRSLLGNVVVLVVGTSLIAGAALTVFALSTSGARWLGMDASAFAWVLGPVVMMEALQQVLLAHLRARRQPVAFSVSTATRLFGIVGGALWFVALEQRGVEGVYLGRFVGNLVGTLVLVGFCVRHMRIGFSWRRVEPLVRYGLPLVWTTLTGGMLFEMAERHFINTYVSLEEVGYYFAAQKVSNIIHLIAIQPFGIAWGGLIFQIAKKPDAPRIYVTVLLSAYLAVTGVATSMIAAGPLLFALFTSAEYEPGLAVFPLFLLAHSFRMLEYLAALAFYLTKKTHWLAGIYSLSLVVSLVGNMSLVPTFGMVGAASTRVIALVSALLAMIVLGRRYYPMPIMPSVIILALVPWAATAWFMHGAPVELSLAATAQAVAISLAAFALLALLGWRVIVKSRTVAPASETLAAG